MGIGMTQAFHYQTDNKKGFLTIIDTICRIVFPNIEGVYNRLFISTLERGFNNGRKWVGPDNIPCTDDNGWSKPTKFFICTIKDYRADIKREKPHVILINRHEEIVKHIDEFLNDDPNFKKPLSARFFEKCGKGYTDWFMTSDGDVDIGYCVSYRPSGGWDALDVSLTHIYYGK